MKVLHLSHGYPPECNGGIERYLQGLLAGQRAAGVDAMVLAGSQELWPEVGIEALEVDGIPVRRIHRDDLYFDLYAKLHHPVVERRIGELLGEERPDLVHVHQWIRLTGNLVEIAARLGIPAVVTLHDLYTTCPRCFRVRADGEACSRLLSVASCLDCVPRFGHEGQGELIEGIRLFSDQLRAELAMAASVLVANGATVEVVRASTGFGPERFELLPMPYEPRFEDPGTGAAPGATPLPSGDEPFRFAYWGNLTSRKGTQVLARAFRELVEAGPPRPVELHFFGEVDTPELESELGELTAGLPVVFHGRYSFGELASAGIHMAVFPMLCFETHGFVLDECFELGLPCVVSDIGALSRRAGKAALRVPPRDASALAEALGRVLARPDLRDELARRIVRPSLAVEEHLERLLGIYASSLAAGPSPAEPVPAWRRERLLLLQRESAQARIVPEGGPR